MLFLFLYIYLWLIVKKKKDKKKIHLFLCPNVPFSLDQTHQIQEHVNAKCVSMTLLGYSSMSVHLKIPLVRASKYFCYIWKVFQHVGVSMTSLFIYLFIFIAIITVCAAPSLFSQRQQIKHLHLSVQQHYFPLTLLNNDMHPLQIGAMTSFTRLWATLGTTNSYYSHWGASNTPPCALHSTRSRGGQGRCSWSSGVMNVFGESRPRGFSTAWPEPPPRRPWANTIRTDYAANSSPQTSGPATPPLSSSRTGRLQEGGRRLPSPAAGFYSSWLRRTSAGDNCSLFFCLCPYPRVHGDLCHSRNQRLRDTAPVATHRIGLSLWIMSAIKERKRGEKKHACAHTQPDLNNRSWQILVACRWPPRRARLRASGLAGRCPRPCITFWLIKQSQT